MPLDTISSMWKGFFKQIEHVAPRDFASNRTFRNVIALNLGYDFWQHTDGYKGERYLLTKNFKEHPWLPCNRKRVGAPMNVSSEQYILQLCILLRAFPEIGKWSILEIGGGFGGLCRILCLAYPSIKQYTLYDHNAMLRVAKKFMKDQVRPKMEFCSLEKREGLLEQRYDLMISNYCLSETPVAYQGWVQNHIFPVCKRVFVIDGDQKQPIFEREMRAALRHNVGNHRVDPYPALPHQKQKVYTAWP